LVRLDEGDEKTGRPLVLTINGKAEAVVLDPIIYEQGAEHLDVIARSRRGLAQAKRGGTDGG
jgi:hypothetical protein